MTTPTNPLAGITAWLQTELGSDPGAADIIAKAQTVEADTAAVLEAAIPLVANKIVNAVLDRVPGAKGFEGTADSFIDGLIGALTAKKSAA